MRIFYCIILHFFLLNCSNLRTLLCTLYMYHQRGRLYMIPELIWHFIYTIKLRGNHFRISQWSLAGDLNSRNKDYIDFILHDNLDFVFGEVDYEGSNFELRQNNRDLLRGNNIGKSLVQLCGIIDIHFSNGRFEGDREEISHVFQITGSLLSMSELFEYIRNFSVLDRSESDHFPLPCCFKLYYLNNKNSYANSWNNT